MLLSTLEFIHSQGMVFLVHPRYDTYRPKKCWHEHSVWPTNKLTGVTYRDMGDSEISVSPKMTHPTTDDDLGKLHHWTLPTQFNLGPPVASSPNTKK